MARMTWLEMVQSILNDLDSDPVTTYNETEESRQVSEILEITYFSIIDSREWPYLFSLFKLTQTSASTPTIMTIGDTVKQVKYIKYNTRTVSDTKDIFSLIKYLPPQSFMTVTDARDNSLSTVDTMTDLSGVSINIFNNQGPKYYTSFDEKNLVFDAFDSGVDTFLTSNKSQAYGMIYPTITISDALDLSLPTDMFTYLLAEAKATAFIVLKQAQNPRAELNSFIQNRRLLKESWKFRENATFPDTRGDIISQSQGQNRQ